MPTSRRLEQKNIKNYKTHDKNGSVTDGQYFKKVKTTEMSKTLSKLLNLSPNSKLYHPKIRFKLLQ